MNEFNIDDSVTINGTIAPGGDATRKQTGLVTGRAVYKDRPAQVFVEYIDVHGNHAEGWFHERQLTKA